VSLASPRECPSTLLKSAVWRSANTVRLATVQIAKMRHGFGKVASIFLGEAGLVAAVGLSLPDWWIQGDAAVAQATTMRGNVVQYASSEMMTRTMLLSGEHFSYMKAMHGSFKDRFFGSSLVRVNIALKELIHCVALITHVMSALQFGGTYLNLVALWTRKLQQVLAAFHVFSLSLIHRPSAGLLSRQFYTSRVQ
jgi:hypothetical protein